MGALGGGGNKRKTNSYEANINLIKGQLINFDVDFKEAIILWKQESHQTITRGLTEREKYQMCNRPNKISSNITEGKKRWNKESPTESKSRSQEDFNTNTERSINPNWHQGEHLYKFKFKLITGRITHKTTYVISLQQTRVANTPRQAWGKTQGLHRDKDVKNPVVKLQFNPH